MPVDLTEYGHSIKVALKRSGFACVYVASLQDGRPCRVGYALDLADAIKRLERSSPMPLVVDNAMWVPDRGMATNIAQSVLASIAEHRRTGGWHDLPAESVTGAVHLETFRLYPNALAVPHDQLISRWKQKISASLRL